MTKRVTITAVNKALEAADYPERICKGNGYWYFIEGQAHTWRSSSVMTCHLSDFTVEQWVAERNELANRSF